MTSKVKAAPAPAPGDDSNGQERILSGAELLAYLREAKARAAQIKAISSTTATVKIDRRVVWSDRLVTAAEALQPPLILPETAPTRGVSVQGMARGLLAAVAAPRDLSALNRPVPPNQGRGDALLVLVRGWIWNQLYGCPIYQGQSMAEGGRMPLEVILNTLPLEAERYATTAWSQTLFGNGATCILYQLSQVSGRFAVLDCNTETISLVRDFHA